MKRFILRISIFIFLVICLDYVSGYIFQHLIKSAKSGDTARNEYIVNKMTEPLLFFGSSRSIHHYNPQIFKDSLGIDCYNCGNNGQGIVLFYGRYKMLTERYIPQIIIYDITDGFDICNGDNYGYLTWLKPYYDHNGIDSIFINISPTEKYKMMSNLYRYNGKILQIIGDNLVNIREENKGYRPLYGVMNYSPHNNEMKNELNVDSIKLYYFEQFILECKNKGSKLFLAYSPFYGESEINPVILDLVKKHNVPIISFLNNKEFINNPELFQDSYHMNYKGANLFSSKFVSKIKNYIFINQNNNE